MIAALTTFGSTTIAQSMDVSGEFAGEFAETTHQAISATRCAPRYVGCYPDKISERAVEYLAGVVHSPAQCASLCASYGYEAKGEWAGLFALQNNVPGRAAPAGREWRTLAGGGDGGQGFAPGMSSRALPIGTIGTGPTTGAIGGSRAAAAAAGGGMVRQQQQQQQQQFLLPPNVSFSGSY